LKVKLTGKIASQRTLTWDVAALTGLAIGAICGTLIMLSVELTGGAGFQVNRPPITTENFLLALFFSIPTGGGIGGFLGMFYLILFRRYCGELRLPRDILPLGICAILVISGGILGSLLLEVPGALGVSIVMSIVGFFSVGGYVRKKVREGAIV
jgi:hypothetical protein